MNTQPFCYGHWNVLFTDGAQQGSSQLTKGQLNQVSDALLKLSVAMNPVDFSQVGPIEHNASDGHYYRWKPAGFEKLKYITDDVDWRVVFYVNKQRREIVVVAVGNRAHVYNRRQMTTYLGYHHSLRQKVNYA